MAELASRATQQIILASNSWYRRRLLEQLGLPFLTVSPDLDERRLPGEAPSRLVRRLAWAKANAVRGLYPQALLIGSDQVAVLDGDILRKPGDRRTTIQQLTRASGRRVQFVTGLCLLNARTGSAQVDVIACTVQFRPLSGRQIERYVEREKPYDCAGGFKSEGLGIALFSRIDGNDPTALVGLPLMRLVTMLHKEGVDVLAASNAAGRH